jgi:hypothetical protein
MWFAILFRSAEAGCGPAGCTVPEVAAAPPAAATAPIPPIDRERPAEVRTAVFALG